VGPLEPAEVPAALRGRRVAVLVSGGIAAYKVADVVSRLVQAGCEVRVAMTAAATRFVGPATFHGLSGRPVQTDLFAADGPPEPHVELGDWAQVALVAPATADLVARLAHGHADDLVAATVLAARCPVVVAPAMNDAMWAKPAVGENVAALRASGFTVVEPESGHLASGHVGAGRVRAPCWPRSAGPPAAAGTWPAGGWWSAPAAPANPSTPCASLATTRAARWGSPWRRRPRTAARR
jgi:phosphopantothenoylcysteine decarboxylase/phosphopantothenate--cysteine ligase